MDLKNVKKLFFALPALLLMTASLCHAQFSASVQGTVKDPTGAVVPGARVTLHSVDTGADSSVTTGSGGTYGLTEVAPGNYEVRVVAKGFRPANISVAVTTGETRGLDAILTIGESTSVSVDTAATALNPAETRLQQTVTATEISQLPLPNRDIQEIIALTPGVVGYQNPSVATPGTPSTIFASSYTPPYQANGLGINSNLYIIDDLPVSDALTQGAALMLPNTDMVSEASLQTQTYSVENGTAASLQVAFNTKSGTNRYHGTVDETYASQNLGSAYPVEFGAPPYGAKPPFHQNIFIASLGGPIFKDRTFFFGSVAKQNADIVSNSPSYPFFAPQFVAWANSAFPNAGPPQGLAFAPNSRDNGGTTALASAFSGLNCGSPQPVPANKSLTYNLPCDTPTLTTGATFNQSQPFNGTQWSVRLDQTFRGGNDRIYGLYQRVDQKFAILSDRPALDADAPSQNKYFTVSYVHVFNSDLVNEAHFGNLRSIGGTQLGKPQAAGIPYLPITLFTDLNFTFTFPFGITPFSAQTQKQHTYAFRDTLSYTFHKHALRAGYQYFRGDVFEDSSEIYSRPFVPFYATDSISWISNQAQAGYDLYTVGPSATIGGPAKFVPQYYGASSTFNALFVEDTWKARDNLTLTFGLRWDDFGNPSPYGGGGVFVPLFPGAGSTFQEQAINTSTRITNSAFPSSQDDNFAPRVGFAYSPKTVPDTLVRGGLGFYYNALTPFQIAGNLPTQPPNRISLNPYGIVPYGDFKTAVAPFGYNYNVGNTYGVAPNGNVYSNAAQTASFPANINGFAPHVTPDRILNYSLGLEHQFQKKFVLGINYAGGYGYNIIYGASAVGGSNSDFNLEPGYSQRVAAKANPRPTPAAGTASEFGQINYGVNGLNSNYNSLIVTARQNFKSFSLIANYNWSRALGYAPTEADTETGQTSYLWKAAYDPKDDDYGPQSFDVPNAFTLAAAYEIPKVAQNRILDTAFSKWRISTFTQAQSGTPFTVLEAGADYQNDGTAALDGTNNETPGIPTYNRLARKFSRADAREGVFASFVASKNLLCSNPSACAFSDPAGVGTESVSQTQGINTFRNLGYFNVNLSLSKGFGVPTPKPVEGLRFYLRGEAINLLNRTNYLGFHNDVTDGDFGEATAANSKRYLQLGGRLEF